MNHELLRALFSLTLVSSGSALLALCLRRPVRRLLGATTSCSMWLLVPASMVAVLLPHVHAPGAASSGPALMATPASAFQSVLHVSFVAAGATSQGDGTAWVIWAWIAGVASLLCYFVAQQHAFVKSLGLQSSSRRVLRSPTADCPAVMGLLRPKLILPADFRHRYTHLERRLILSHERAHLRRGDLAWNAIATGLRCLFWFNPLAHLAVACFRADQELACDAAVMIRHLGARRTYGAAMLKTHLAAASFPLSCGWNSASALKERLRMLGHAPSSRARRTGGCVCVALTCLSGSYTAWATQPADPGIVGPQTATTPPLGSPRGVVASESAGSSCERWHPTRVFGGSNAAIYAENVNPDGSLAKVLAERRRGPVVVVAVAHSARHDVSKDGTTHIFTLYDGARYEGNPGSERWRLTPFEELDVPMQLPPQTGGAHNLDAESSKELQSFIDMVTRVGVRWHTALPCP